MILYLLLATNISKNMDNTAGARNPRSHGANNENIISFYSLYGLEIKHWFIVNTFEINTAGAALSWNS